MSPAATIVTVVLGGVGPGACAWIGTADRPGPTTKPGIGGLKLDGGPLASSSVGRTSAEAVSNGDAVTTDEAGTVDDGTGLALGVGAATDCPHAHTNAAPRPTEASLTRSLAERVAEREGGMIPSFGARLGLRPGAHNVTSKRRCAAFVPIDVRSMTVAVPTAHVTLCGTGGESGTRRWPLVNSSYGRPIRPVPS